MFLKTTLVVLWGSAVPAVGIEKHVVEYWDLAGFKSLPVLVDAHAVIILLGLPLKLILTQRHRQRSK